MLKKEDIKKKKHSKHVHSCNLCRGKRECPLFDEEEEEEES
jgi:hypothetical protein